MRVLVTGFEPFGEHRVNPSQVVAEKVGGVILPVSAARLEDELRGHVERERPDVVLGLGLAALRTQVAIERVALNVLDFAIPDNDGAFHEGTPIVNDGPAAYFATVPVKAILAAWLQDEIPAYLSNTAGTFICNQQLYLSCRMARDHGFSAGFIHLPDTERVPMAQQVRAVEQAIAVLEGRLQPVPALMAGASD